MNLSFVAALVPERRVLVIDADLNSPQAAERLGVHSPCGLSEVLAEGVHPADAIRNAAPNGYDLLSAGRMSPQASDLLGSRRMCVLLRELKHSYDLIVVNGPQITEHSINQFRVGLDAVYLVVQMLCTGRKEVDRALKRSQEGGITVDGCVLAYTGRHVPHSIHAYLDSFGENAFAPTAADESSVAATETSDAKFTANQPPAGHGIADDEVPATDVNDNAYDFLADVLSLVGEPKEQSEYVATEPEQVEPDSSLAGLSAATSDVAHTDDPGVNLSLFECADTLLPNAESTQTADKLHAETLRRLETLQPFDQEVDSPRADCQEPIGAPPLDTELEASSGGSNDPALATTPACSGASTDPTDRVAADGFATETSLIRIPRIARRLLQSRVADVEAAAARAAVRDPWAADLLAFSGLLLAVAGILYVAPDVLLWF